MSLTLNYESMEVMKTRSAHEHQQNLTLFWRQLFVCSGVWPSFFIVGLSIGAPTVFVPQMRQEANSSAVVSDEMASWLSSTTHYAALPWVFILVIASEMFGRKIPMLFVALSSLVGFVVFYYSTNLVHLLICEVLMGLSSGSQITTSILILTEYTSPTNRGVFLTIKSASMFWGIWTSNIIGTFFHWRNISIIGIMCSLYALFSIVFWPESPYWLARKRRFKECVASQRWLKGSSLESDEELERLLLEEVEAKKTNYKEFYITFMSHKLYKPILISSIVIALYHFSGKLVCSIYAIDIIEKMTSSKSTAYTGMLILDGVTVFGMYVGCLISKFVKRRTQLLASSSVAVLTLFMLSFYLYLIKLNVLSDNKLICLALLVIFSLSICCGPIIMSTSVNGELLPLKCRNFSVCLMALIANLFFATSIKFGPMVFKSFGMDGAFLFYGVCSSVFLLLTFKYLPESKDKSLQEIQDYFKNEKGSVGERNKLINAHPT